MQAEKKMGHDIRLIGKDGLSVAATTYISFNWSVLRHIFHVDEIHGHDNLGKSDSRYSANVGKLITNVRFTDGRISRRLREALAVLKDSGFLPTFDMRVDGWGHWKVGTKVEAGMLVEVSLPAVDMEDFAEWYTGPRYRTVSIDEKTR